MPGSIALAYRVVSVGAGPASSGGVTSELDFSVLCSYNVPYCRWSTLHRLDV
jgi:hypothetical protein